MHDPTTGGIGDIPIVGHVLDDLIGALDGAVDFVAHHLPGHDLIDLHHPAHLDHVSMPHPQSDAPVLDAGTGAALGLANQLSIQNAKLGAIAHTVEHGQDLSHDQQAELDRVGRAAASWGATAFNALDASQRISHDVYSSIDRHHALDAAHRAETDAWIEGQRAERLIADTNAMLPADKQV